MRSHVNSVMDHLDSERDRDIAVNIFQYLVTPSRSKVAQSTKDLVSFAERPESEVKEVLIALTDRSESRNLASEKPDKVRELAEIWKRQTDEYFALARRDAPSATAKKPNAQPRDED